MTETTPNTDLSISTDFDARLKKFVEGAQAKSDQNWSDNGYTHGKSPLIVSEYATKYVRIWKQDRDVEGKVLMYGVGKGARPAQSIYCFIDRTNGNILKAASYKAPAKGNPRGNMMTDEDYGLHGVTHHGAVYLRG